MLQVTPKSERSWVRQDGLERYSQDLFPLGFNAQAVLHDMTLRPGASDAPQAHRNLEVLTIVLQGTLAHKDSLENGFLLQPGEIQRMTAGEGNLHTEFNPSDIEPVHYLQFQFQPERADLPQDYQQAVYTRAELRGRWKLLASREEVAARDGRGGSVAVHQDVLLLATCLPYGEETTYELPPEKIGWVQVAQGVVQLNGKLMEAGDGAAVQGEPVQLECVSNEAEIFLMETKYTQPNL